MVDAFTHILKLFTDKTVRWTTKSATFILILFGLWFFNNIFDFLHSYRTNNKLEQLDHIAQLLADTSLTLGQKNYLLTERQYIYDHKTALDYFLSFCDSVPNPISFIKRKTAHKAHTTEQTSNNSLNHEIKTDSIIVKNYWLHFIFSNTLLLLLMAVVPFSISLDKKTGLNVLIVATIAIWIILLLMCFFVSYLLNFIPIIAGRPWLNYIVDFLIQTIFWTILITLLDRLAKSKKTT